MQSLNNLGWMLKCMVDPLIQRMRENKRFLELLERVWGIFYFEGSGPDIGIRRENFIKEAIKEELNLESVHLSNAR